MPPRLVEVIEAKLLTLDRLEAGFAPEIALGLLLTVTLLLLFCSLLKLRTVNPVEDPVNPVDELPEQVSSEEDDIDGKDLFE